MSVLKMKRINIYALKKHRKRILELLQRKGIVQVEDLTLDDSVFQKEETTQKQMLFQKNSGIAENAYNILNKYIPDKKSPFAMFSGRSPITVESYYMFTEDANEIMRVAYDIIGFDKEISDSKAEIIKLKSQIETLIPWETLDLPMNFSGTNTTTAFIGTLPQLITYEEIVSQIVEKGNSVTDVNIEIISADENQTCLFLLCKKEKSVEISGILRSLGFSKPTVTPSEPPAECIKKFKKQINNALKNIEATSCSIVSYVGVRNALKFICDYYIMRSEKYAVIEQLAHTKRTFVLTGYIPEKCVEDIEKLLTSKYDAAVEIEEPSPNEDTPVLLKNNPFAEPVESVLETYSLPGKKEIDPTSVMAIFYYVFFGMMFSDAGYGIIMAVGCGLLLHKFKNMELGLRKSVKMFMFCGVSTTFWGLMFGSFFGDAVAVVGKTFFNADISLPPLWFNPVEGSNSMTLLMVCFLFGLIHLFTGLGMKAYTCIKNKAYIDILYDVFSWMLLVGGGVMALLSMDMMESMTGFVLPSVFMTVGGVCAAIGAVIILLFQGRGSKPIKRLLKGAYGLYGVTGYLSDILSYSRLLALGLATGVIAQVFNQIASMFGGGFGVILFIIIFIIGHSLNIGINALGAYVHTNRLQFVEFFGKFYEGGGKKFSPFKINTKYYKIKEDIFNG
ncbi:MAG TPA: V-type ATP synthase subunit I [Clostridiales bacterium]|nr:V-type ATP synthase subunit I [Clostridiales bacterium]